MRHLALRGGSRSARFCEDPEDALLQFRTAPLFSNKPGNRDVGAEALLAGAAVGKDVKQAGATRGSACSKGNASFDYQQWQFQE